MSVQRPLAGAEAPVAPSATTASSPTTGRRIDAVDGLRALAVAAVVAFHFGAPLRGGFLGVDLFFVISGFVITRMLVHQREAGTRFRYGSFLARRVRRLLPVLVVVIAVTQLWLFSAGDALQRAGDKQTVAAAAYVSNWYAIFGTQSYWDIHSDLTPFNHLWSLSVEEQFYLVWPWLLLLTLAFIPRRLGAVLVVGLALVSYGLAFWVGSGNAERAYLGTDTRAGALLLGAALGLWLGRGAYRPVGARPMRAAVTVVGAVALGVFAAACALGWTITTPALYSGGLLAVGIAEAALVWSVVHGGPLARFFGSRPVRAVGRASYSIYLWHWVLWVAVSSAPAIAEPSRAVLATAGTVVLSAVSYCVVERPLQRRAPRTVLVASIAGLLLLAALALLTMPPEPAGAGPFG